MNTNPEWLCPHTKQKGFPSYEKMLWQIYTQIVTGPWHNQGGQQSAQMWKRWKLHPIRTELWLLTPCQPFQQELERPMKLEAAKESSRAPPFHSCSLHTHPGSRGSRGSWSHSACRLPGAQNHTWGATSASTPHLPRGCQPVAASYSWCPTAARARRSWEHITNRHKSSTAKSGQRRKVGNITCSAPHGISEETAAHSGNRGGCKVTDGRASGRDSPACGQEILPVGTALDAAHTHGMPAERRDSNSRSASFLNFKDSESTLFYQDVSGDISSKFQSSDPPKQSSIYIVQ